jgi:hypothetical protein
MLNACVSAPRNTTYAFQARAVIPSGYTDWTHSVTQMAL